MTQLRLISLAESAPGPLWRDHFRRLWPAYRAWYTRDHHRRPTLAHCAAALRRHMPELVPTHHALVSLTQDDPLAARMLSLWAPPPFMAGCSQAVWTRARTPGPLIRNYEFSPDLFEGVLLRTDWTRPVLGMSDCLWGLLDGINDAGLCLALAFGGRDALGEGFGITLALRYALETCTSTAAAAATLARLPIHMAYNVSILDADADHAVVELAPDRPARIRRDTVCTNHQSDQTHAPPRGARSTHPPPVADAAQQPASAFSTRYAALTATHERDALLRALLDTPRLTQAALLKRFLKPPLFSPDYSRGWGTLYTAAYHPHTRSLDLHWPSAPTLTQSIADFTPGTHQVPLV